MKLDPHKAVQKALSKNHACYVLITCEHPKTDGNMQVEMTYDGDVALAAYLIDGAQAYIDQEMCAEEEVDVQLHIVE